MPGNSNREPHCIRNLLSRSLPSRNTERLSAAQKASITIDAPSMEGSIVRVDGFLGGSIVRVDGLFSVVNGLHSVMVTSQMMLVAALSAATSAGFTLDSTCSSPKPQKRLKSPQADFRASGGVLEFRP